MIFPEPRLKELPTLPTKAHTQHHTPQQSLSCPHMLLHHLLRVASFPPDLTGAAAAGPPVEKSPPNARRGQEAPAASSDPAGSAAFVANSESTHTPCSCRAVTASSQPTGTLPVAISFPLGLKVRGNPDGMTSFSKGGMCHLWREDELRRGWAPAQPPLGCTTEDENLGVSTFHLSNGLLRGPDEVMCLFGHPLIQQIFIQHLLHTVAAAWGPTLKKLYPDLVEIKF
jgi:hypothetical protein